MTDSLTQLISDEGVCRTALVTPGLLSMKETIKCVFDEFFLGITNPEPEDV